MLARLVKLGPGAMVAAAFIGPGTVTTATLAGAGYGYTLLWAVVFSVLATCVLQEMAVRLGVMGNMGLGEAIRSSFTSPLPRFLAVALVMAAIFIGNAAYEAGNIAGAGLAFNASAGEGQTGLNLVNLAIGIAAFILLVSGRYKVIEKSLMTLVAVLGLVFVSAAIFSKPDLGLVLKGLFIPEVPENGLLMVVGLIGTTVVPYNLFLHASSVRQRYGSSHLREARWDSFISIFIGGLITGCIIVAAAASVGDSMVTPETISDLGKPLTVLLGEWSTLFVGLGFLAAGLSSAVTAPLAAAYAITGILGWNQDMKGYKFRIIWLPVLLTGILFSSIGLKPVSVILFAQVANGILLPVTAIFLLKAMNDRNIVGTSVNSRVVNILGGLVLVVTLVLGIKSIFQALSAL